MESFSSVIQSVYTNRILRSVYTEGITDRIFRIKKKKRFADVEVFASDFTDGITEGFKSGSPYSDVTDSPLEWPMKSPT